MKYILILIVAATLSACAGPKFSSTPLQYVDSPIVIIKDNETRAGFLQTMENWLRQNGYEYTVLPDGSRHRHEDLTLEYEGEWSWDLALYLTDAEIKAYNNGQRVAEVSFKVPRITANLGKFGSAEKRINEMMNRLFANVRRP